VAGAYGIKHVFGALGDLLSWGEFDAILVASPISLHYEQIKACLEHGFHVHTQKTLANTYRDGHALRQLARSQGVVLAASPGQILLPAYAHAQSLIQAQWMGQLYGAWGVNVVSGHERDPFVTDPSWYYQPGGGPLADMGIYNLHALIDLLGMPQRVSAMTGRPLPEKHTGAQTVQVETADNICLMMDWGAGVIGTLCTAFAYEPEILRWGHLAIIGDRGTIEVCRSATQPGRYAVLQRSDAGVDTVYFDHGLPPEHERMEEAHVYLDIHDFVEAILQRRSPRASVDTACAALAIIDAVSESADSGCTVTLASL
jgi:predicted dehydrogenase